MKRGRALAVLRRAHVGSGHYKTARSGSSGRGRIPLHGARAPGPTWGRNETGISRSA